ncbi:DUF4145 domain-containing protein [Neobacillus sp. D3-1R]|uniref:DUF4145 domain-containing protein n=1 Tax=Neobacillus sp. D3-1R TaxID=3445778 RepID=UPI003FA1526F
MTQFLFRQIERFEQQLELLKGEMKQAYHYLEDDPMAALQKTRTILERILKDVYEKEMGKPPKANAMIGTLIDKGNPKNMEFIRKIDVPIFNQVEFIQKMGNFASHDQGDKTEQLKITHVVSTLTTLCDILDWYAEKYIGETTPQSNLSTASFVNRESTKVIKNIHNVQTDISGPMTGNFHLGIGNQIVNKEVKK